MMNDNFAPVHSQMYGHANDPWGFVMMIIFGVLIVLGIVILVKFLGNSSTSKPDDAITILRNRFANGEIDTKEFEERVKALSE